MDACFQLGLSAVQTSEPTSKTWGSTLLVLLLRIVSCIVSWQLYWDTYHIVEKCIVIGLIAWQCRDQPSFHGQLTGELSLQEINHSRQGKLIDEYTTACLRFVFPVLTTLNTSSSPTARTFGKGTSHLPCGWKNKGNSNPGDWEHLRYHLCMHSQS